MAIDTDEKKYSSMLMGMPFRMSVPIPSQVGFTDAQKQQMLYQYSGLSWVASVAAKGVRIISSSTKDVIQIFSGIVDSIQSTFDVK